MEWFLKALKQYADFNGRARRKEYWMFVLFSYIALIVAAILDNILGITLDEFIFYGWFYLLTGLALFIPNLAVSVRRLHDLGKSGWNYLFILIPFAGPIILLIWFVTDSQRGDNKWGENPKGIGNTSVIDQIGKE